MVRLRSQNYRQLSRLRLLALAGAVSLALALISCAPAAAPSPTAAPKPAATSAPATSAAPAPTAAPASATTASKPEAPKADFQSRTLKLGHILNAGDPTDLGSQRFAEIVKERTGGKVTVQIFPASQLGTGPQQIEQIRSGTLELFVGGIAWFEAFKGMEDLKVFSAPPLFRDAAHAKKTLDTELGDKFWSVLEKDYGINVLAYNWWWPPRQLLANKAINSRADLNGVKLRVPEVEMYVLSWKALGASPTPLAWGEVYTGLSQGLVDAAEAGMTLMYSSKLQEVAKNMTMTNHTYVPVTFIANDQLFKSLEPELQEILVEAAVEAGEVSNSEYVKAEASVLDQFKAAGVNIIELADRDEFFAPIEQLAKDLEAEGKWTAGLYERIKAIN